MAFSDHKTHCIFLISRFELLKMYNRMKLSARIPYKATLKPFIVFSVKNRSIYLSLHNPERSSEYCAFKDA